MILWRAYFGLSWEEMFGDYGYAYVAYPNYDYSDNPGVVDNLDFRFHYYGEGGAWSPVVAFFEHSGSVVGETNMDNPNSVPVPGTVLLFSKTL